MRPIFKSVLPFVLLAATRLHAQTTLHFDKRFVESEDRWVAFPPEKDSSFAYGFIYIDPQAGLTFNYEGKFKVGPTGAFVPAKLENTSMKVRLEPNNVLVAFLPDNKFGELGIAATPDWLKYYKTDTASVQRLYRWGYMYNAWDQCAKALTYLERAEKIDPAFKGLAVELAFSYNCLKQYDKAEAILAEAIKTNATDAYVNKEYIFTLTKNGKTDKAVRQFEQSQKNLDDHQYDAENCFNILQYFYLQKDKASFDKWYAVLQGLPNKNGMITRYANTMKAELGK